MVGLSLDDLRAQSKTAADRAVRSDLALEAVAAAEGIETADADIEEEIAKLAKQHDMEVDRLRAVIDPEDVRRDLTMRKTLELVKGAVKKPAKKAAKKADKAEEQADEETKNEE